MAGQVDPTPEQLRAAHAPEPRVNIEAAPGSGKTTVAAERFGVYRFVAGLDPRGVLALSFTRSARDELAERVRSRWGTQALARPHLTLTFDRLHQLLLRVLLEEGHVTWPHTGEELRFLDSWRGVSGNRRLNLGDSHWVGKLRGTTVGYGAAPVPSRGEWMSTAAGIRSQIEAGVCTHEDVRSIVHGALANASLRQVLTSAMAARFRAVIVDEGYDANTQDLDLIAMFCGAGLPTMLIGDRWQALYGFRGARPDLVGPMLTQLGFAERQVTRSFRYSTPELESQMAQLRDGEGLTLPNGLASECDVVLSSGWDGLWGAGACVLPVGIGSPSNKSDALLILVLNRVTTLQLALKVPNLAEACFLLGVPDSDDERDAALDECLSDLRAGALSSGFEGLRARHRGLGIARKPTRLTGTPEAKLDEQLARLRVRLAGQHLVAGLSVHQAKGREYDRVGLRLKPAEVKRLRRGLNPDEPKDRVLYVAATRARRSTVLV